MLLGEHRQAINSHGQLALPEQVLSRLDGELVLTRGFERNLLLFPVQEWLVLAEKLLAQPISNSDVRMLRRRLFSAAATFRPDEQGRIRLPDSLRKFAGINGEVILTGLYDHVELWSVEQWQRMLESVEAATDDGRWDGIGI